MPRSFRFAPPKPSAGLVTRPRLLRALLHRWDLRVVTVVGGPGFGKTTLLAQAMVENGLAPRGDDVWIGLEAADNGDDSLALAVGEALSLAPKGSAGRTASGQPPRPDQVADAIWGRSPTDVCLVFDDVHHLVEGSAGAAWLAGLMDALPANGHLLMASRNDPPVKLARLQAHGEAIGLSEDDLRFNPDELAGFATRRGLKSHRFDESGGWPALVELGANTSRSLGGDYLWEEVLEPLGPDRRRIFAVVCDLGGADTDLASAALGTPVDLADDLAGIPLVATSAEGWHIPHALWQSAERLTLSADDQSQVRRRAVEHFLDRHRFDDAFALVSETGLWDLVSEVLLAACVAAERPTAGQLERWLAASPGSVGSTAGGRLATGLFAGFRTPMEALDPLAEAAEACQAAGHADGELTALAELGRVAWWRQNLDALAGPARRVAELAEEGHGLAQSLSRIGDAVVADLLSDDQGVLRALEAIQPGILDPRWEATARWFRARILLSLGDAEAAMQIIETTDPGPDLSVKAIFAGLRVATWFGLGRVDDGLAAIRRSVDDDWSGVEHNRRLGVLGAAALQAHAGQVDSAQAELEKLDADRQLPLDRQSAPWALAHANLLVAKGDDAGATQALEIAREHHGLDQGPTRRVWRQYLGISYVLLPGAAAHWDSRPFRGYLADACNLSAAVVKLRSTPTALDWLRTLKVPDSGIVRTALHHRLAAELAVGLHAVDRAEGAELLRALGPAGRNAVRDLATRSPQHAHAKHAKSLLGAVPAPPPKAIHVGALGPLLVLRGGPYGDEVTGPDLRRERVRALLADLVSHRRATRAELMARLWPDLDERSAANNLRVTLTYLTRVLEPERPAGEPAYLLQARPQLVELVADSHLTLDVDQFDQHVEEARQAERDGMPSVALEHNLAAIELYRGDLHADAPEAEWMVLDREHYRTRFVAAAARAGELLLGRGDTEAAEQHARRALTVDPWAEQAHTVLVASALARGDRSAARRRLETCMEALAEVGFEPTDTIGQLRRRIRTG